MKKLIFTSLFLMLTIASFAQGFYLHLNAGYEFPIAGQSYFRSTNNPNSINMGKTSYAKGILPMIGAGYMFNENIGLDFSVGYLLGSPVSVFDFSSGINGSDDIKISSVLIQPAIKLAVKNDNKVSPYAKIGVTAAVAAKGTDDNTVAIGYSNQTTNSTQKFYTGIGMSGAFGLTFKMDDVFRFTAEVNMMAMSVYIKSSTTNGTTTTYNTNVTSIRNSTNSSTYSYPYSHMGLLIGLMASFGKK